MYENSKTIGNIGEAIAIAEFTKRNIPVLIPFGDNLPFDLVIIINNEFKKIQTKTTENIKDGKMLFCTDKTNGIKGTSAKYTKDEIDYFFLYCIENNYCGLISIDESMVNELPIRTEKPKNNQVKGIRMMDDYLLDNILQSCSSVG